MLIRQRTFCRVRGASYAGCAFVRLAPTVLSARIMSCKSALINSAGRNGAMSPASPIARDRGRSGRGLQGLERNIRSRHACSVIAGLIFIIFPTSARASAKRPRREPAPGHMPGFASRPEHARLVDALHQLGDVLIAHVPGLVPFHEAFGRPARVFGEYLLPILACLLLAPKRAQDREVIDIGGTAIAGRRPA